LARQPAPGGPRLSLAGPPWEDPGHSDKAVQGSAGSILAYTPGVRSRAWRSPRTRMTPTSTRREAISSPSSATGPRSSGWETLVRWPGSRSWRARGSSSRSLPTSTCSTWKSAPRTRRRHPLLPVARADGWWNQPGGHPLARLFLYRAAPARKRSPSPSSTMTSTARLLFRARHCSRPAPR